MTIHQIEKLLIFDLDETLVFATDEELEYSCDFEAYHYFVYKRPYLNEFLSFCSKHFRLAVWTSSNAFYAAHVVNHVFPDEIELEFIWDRSRCVQKFDATYYCYDTIKDLKKVKRKGFPLEQVIMLDNTPKKTASKLW